MSSLTPAQRGYRLPAEWEPHCATWLSWPHNAETWPGIIDRVPDTWAALVRELAPQEPVHVLARCGEVMQDARRRVGDLENVAFHDVATNDAWIRDHGPMFLTHHDGQPPLLLDWDYNAWGGKWPPFDDDNRVPAQVAQLLDMQRITPGIILEGGSIDSNGRGAILTTETCLLNPNRNPSLSREEIETYLRDYLGAEHVLWLAGEMEGDDTDAHIDQLARFVSPTTVLAAVEENPSDVNYASLVENYRRLQGMRDQDGAPLEIVPLQMPGPVKVAGQRLPASYANFYIAEGVVIVPQFDDPADEPALRTLEQAFPDRRIVGLRAVDLVVGLGAFHCMTLHQPA